MVSYRLLYSLIGWESISCNKCGKIHAFKKDIIDPDIWREDSLMGTRTEYSFRFEEECDSCGNMLVCEVYVSEYPSGNMEGTPSVQCDGCEVVGAEPVGVEYYDFDAILNSPNTNIFIHTCKNAYSSSDFNVALNDGKAIIDPIGETDFVRGSTIQVELPIQRRLFDILVDETNIIHFDSNGASLAAIIDAANPKNTAIKLLGKVAEAVIVRRCSDNNLVNKKWFDKARRCKSKISVANRFIAIGTGLHSTKLKYPHKYNPADTQRDIIWMDGNGNLANIIGSNTVSGLPAGLQVKVSGNGVNYVQKAIVANKYEVPIVYFPLSDDFEQVVNNIERKVSQGKIDPIIMGEDLINAVDVDPDSYNSVKDYYPIILDLFYGRISADDFVKEAMGIAPMQNAILANALENQASKMLLIR